MKLHELLRALQPYGYAIWHMLPWNGRPSWLIGRMQFENHSYSFVHAGELFIDADGVITSYKPISGAIYGDVSLIQSTLAKGGTHAAADPDAHS